jgi:DNA invertase Pin-like site-specific DNA recombinase
MARHIGYARVSTDDQDLSIQKAALDKDTSLTSRST